MPIYEGGWLASWISLLTANLDPEDLSPTTTTTTTPSRTV